MLKRLLSGISLTLLILIFAPAVASAHVLKVDGSIGAVLHINPDDNPTTGKPTDYTLSFDDSTNRFDVLKCNCSVQIIEQGKVIATKSLAQTDYEFSENLYTFPQAAVYTMRFIGTPKKPGAFQPFTLNYEVRVESGRPLNQPIPILLWVGMGMAIGLILLAAYATNSMPGKQLKDWKQL